MPISPPALSTGFLVPNLLSVGHVGAGLSQLCLGVATGVVEYLTTQATVVTVDAGSLGAGTGLAPFPVPTPVMVSAMQSGFSAAGLIGVVSPMRALGLGNGLSVGLTALCLVQTVHPGIGTGAGVGRVVGPPSMPAILHGFSSVGMVGPAAARQAQAISIGLDVALQSLVIPIPIVGSASPLAGGSAGFGKIV